MSLPSVGNIDFLSVSMVLYSIDALVEVRKEKLSLFCILYFPISISVYPLYVFLNVYKDNFFPSIYDLLHQVTWLQTIALILLLISYALLVLRLYAFYGMTFGRFFGRLLALSFVIILLYAASTISSSNPRWKTHALLIGAFGIVSSLYIVFSSFIELVNKRIVKPVATSIFLYLEMAFRIILTSFLFGFVYSYIGVQEGNCSDKTPGACISHDTLDGIYLSMVTVTTLGYGDVTPTPGIGRVLACIEALTGLLFSSLLFSGIIAILDIQARQISLSLNKTPDARCEDE